MSKLYISVDIGGTNARIALIDQSVLPPRLNERRSFSIPRDYKSGLEAVTSHIQKLSDKYDIEGIGLSLPGIVDPEAGVIKDLSNLPSWKGKPIAADIKARFNKPVKIIHDVAAALLGESEFGAGKDEDSFVYIIWGTGIGGSRLIKSRDELICLSFEVGHHIIIRNGEICACGQKGCVESYISGWALTKKHRDMSKIADDYSLWDEVVEHATQTFMNAGAFYISEKFIFGGGLILKRPFLLSKIQNKINQQMKLITIPKFELSPLGDDAGLYGAVVPFLRKITVYQ